MSATSVLKNTTHEYTYTSAYGWYGVDFVCIFSATITLSAIKPTFSGSTMKAVGSPHSPIPPFFLKNQSH